MKDTDAFIAHLVQSAPPRPAQSLWAVFAVWLGAAIVYIGLILAFYLHPRPDLLEKLTEPLFAAEIASLASLILATIFGAALLCFPDLHQLRPVLKLPPILFALFCGVLFLAWRGDVPPSLPPPDAMECLLCIALLSLLPAIMLFYKIRRMASTRPALAGAYAALTAFAMGALTLRLSETTNSISHVVIWHYAPMLVVACLGVWLGQKLFRW